MADENAPESKKDEFKKPVLFGRVGKLPKKVKHDCVPKTEEPSEEPTEQKLSLESGSKSGSKVSSTDQSVPVPYKEPKWSGMCPDGSEYSLEVLKSGMIVDRVDLTQQPYFVFGRLQNSDVILAHPTISRHHCILQYKAFAEANEPASGWYLYDLGSTHSTYLNKEKLKPSHYTRIRVGHQIKFGNSSRTYILTGPAFDCEGESELSVTEIKQRAQEMKLERNRMIQEIKEQRDRDRLNSEKKREEQGIDWGMGEDAEDETDLSENPFAVTTNEELYLTDPKKTLRGYFEREGHELQYDCEERGPGQYICRVELPLDDARGRPVIAEAIHTGKKKEAVVACALEACRILDRAGLLRQAKHESRRRKVRDWSADDFYDSDDDNYLDRTGQVESKRKERMQRHGALNTDTQVLTHDQLLKQITELESKISLEERTLERLRASIRTNKLTNEQVDDLDQYMESLKAPSMSVKAEISTCKMTIQKLKGELTKTHRLADMARPAHLPPLIKKNDSIIKVTNSVVYGKRIKLKSDTEKKPTARQVSKQDESEFVEEMDSDEEELDNKKNETEDGNRSSQNETEDLDNVECKHKDNDNESQRQTKTKDMTKCNINTNSEPSESDKDSGNPICGNTNPTGGKDSNNSGKDSNNSSSVKKVYGPMRPPEDYVIPEDYYNQESSRDLPNMEE